LRDQARNGDLFKSAPTSKSFDDKSRRRSFLGAYDKEVPLRMYVDSVKQKLERNGNLIYEKRSLSNIEYNVLVNMVIRSDGSIEEVSILRTSGSRAVDEKARNIILANSPYSSFPPSLAAKYDVIEVQRVWHFGDRLRILEELPQGF
jgi:TonB family protein